MNLPLLLLGGGALLWYLKQPGAPSTTLPGSTESPGPPGTTTPPPAGTTPPPGQTTTGGTLIPPPLPSGASPVPIGPSIIPSITWPDPPSPGIPSPQPAISVVRNVWDLASHPTVPSGFPDWIDPDVAPFDLMAPPSPDAVIGAVDIPAEMLTIQQEVEGLLGVPLGSDTALIEAIQSLGPEEAEMFAGLVADQSGMTLEAAKAGLSQLGLIGGPVGVLMGIYTLTQGNVAGVAAIVSGIGVTLTSLAATGAGASLGMSAATMATSAALGVGLSLVGGIAALGPLFHSLFDRGGIFSTDHWVSPTSWRSFMAGNAAHTAMLSALHSATTLGELTAIANAPWAPHGELQVGSTMNRWGWAGDFDDPASPEWIRMLTILRTPVLVALGLPEIPEFIHGLWVQGPGQTGVVPYNPETSFLLQRKFAEALPNLPAYAAIKAAVQPGGDLFEAVEEARRVKAAYDAALQELLDREAAAIAASYGEPGAP